MKTKILSIMFFIWGNVTIAQFTKIYDLDCNTNICHINCDLLYDGSFIYGMGASGGQHVGGTIYKIKADGTGYIKLHDFDELSGKHPVGSLISDGTFLYGVTTEGGANIYYGTIFRIKPDGSNYTVLHDFNPNDGYYPEGSLISDGTYLFGTASSGGYSGGGVVFKMKLDGTGYTKLIDFLLDGTGPTNSLIYDGTFLYGNTTYGGANLVGNIYRIKTDGTGFLKLYDFNGFAGQGRYSSMVSDGVFLYGLTYYSGLNNLGTVFRIKLDGTNYTILKNFNSDTTNGGLGYYPNGIKSDGTFLYVLTNYGGKFGGGTIVKLKPDGSNFIKLLDFSCSDRGCQPNGSLILVNSFLYGSTAYGGDNNAGVIFKQDKNISTPVGLSEQEINYGISISPNPFSSQITIQSKNNFNNAKLSVYNVFGQLLREEKNINGSTFIFLRDDLEVGIYFLQIAQEEKMVLNKMIILEQ